MLNMDKTKIVVFLFKIIHCSISETCILTYPFLHTCHIGVVFLHRHLIFMSVLISSFHFQHSLHIKSFRLFINICMLSIDSKKNWPVYIFNVVEKCVLLVTIRAVFATNP